MIGLRWRLLRVGYRRWRRRVGWRRGRDLLESDREGLVSLDFYFFLVGLIASGQDFKSVGAGFDLAQFDLSASFAFVALLVGPDQE